MSTTIRRFARFAGAAGAVLLAWGAVMATLPFVGTPGRQLAIVADPQVVVASGGKLVDVRGGVVLARSDRPGFAAALYRHGATLVVEGRPVAGCFRKQSD